jgi:hypothetical protein
MVKRITIMARVGTVIFYLLKDFSECHFNFLIETPQSLSGRKRMHSTPFSTLAHNINPYYPDDDDRNCNKMRLVVVEKVKSLRPEPSFPQNYQQQQQHEQPLAQIPVNPSDEIHNTNNLSMSLSDYAPLLAQSSIFELNEEQLTNLPVDDLDQQMEKEIPELLKFRFSSLSDYQLRKLDSLDDTGKTLLHYSCLLKYPETIDALLNTERVNVETTTADGSTALHLAASRGHVEIVRNLVDHWRADVNARDGKGFSALDIAKMQLMHVGKDAKINYDRIIDFLQVTRCIFVHFLALHLNVFFFLSDLFSPKDVVLFQTIRFVVFLVYLRLPMIFPC